MLVVAISVLFPYVVVVPPAPQLLLGFYPDYIFFGWSYQITTSATAVYFPVFCD